MGTWHRAVLCPLSCAAIHTSGHGRLLLTQATRRLLPVAPPFDKHESGICFQTSRRVVLYLVKNLAGRRVEMDIPGNSMTKRMKGYPRRVTEKGGGRSTAEI